MGPRQRHRTILDLLLKKETVTVNDLVGACNVSPITIRRDLSYLEGRGLLQRVRGGAQPNETMVVGSFRAKTQFNVSEKNAIAQRALSMLSPTSNIIIDNGTTTLQFARLLRHVFRGQVVTNSIEIARDIWGANISVIVCGGELNARTGSLVGPKAEEFMSKIKTDYAFIGVSAISLEHGFCASDSFEAEIKSVILRTAEKSFILADHTKFNRNGLFPFASLNEVTAVITNDNLLREEAEKYEMCGLKIIV